MIERPIQIEFQHRVLFTSGVFGVENPTLLELLQDPGRVARALVVIDSSVAASDPELVDRVREYFSAHPGILKLAGEPLIVAGGEACKND